MIQSHYYIRLFLNIIIGIMYAYAMYKMAGNYRSENRQHHPILKTFGCMLIVVAALLFLLALFGIGNVSFPEHSLPDDYMSSKGIYLRSLRDDNLTWGYPIFDQKYTLNGILCSLMILGIGLYLINFQKSEKIGWIRFLKFLFLTVFNYVALIASDFHNFYLDEFFPLSIFVAQFLMIIALKSYPKNISDYTVFEHHITQDSKHKES